MNEYSALDAVGAIGLAMQVAADARASSAVIREILKRAPTPAAQDTAPVALLLEAINASTAEFHLIDQTPRMPR